MRAAAWSVRTWTPNSLARSIEWQQLVSLARERRATSRARVTIWRGGGGGRYPTCGTCSPEPRADQRVRVGSETRYARSMREARSHSRQCHCIVRNVKRPPEYQAGDQRPFLRVSAHRPKIVTRENCSGKCVDREFAELWRKLARPITFFDERSPSIFLTRNRRIL